jgi:hypothetical protein
LKPAFAPKPDENKVEGAPAVLSLAERIKMREQSGDLNTFNETYSNLKTSKNFDEIGIFTKSENRPVLDNGKRKSDHDMDKDLKKSRRKAMDDEYTAESDSDDDLRLVQSQPVLSDITNNNQSSRPKRKSISSKKLVLSEEEDNQGSDDDFLLPANI